LPQTTTLADVGEWLDWIREHEKLLAWLGVVSLLTLVVSAIVVPVLLARIPADYFVPARRSVELSTHSHPVLRVVEAILKNGFGAVLVVAGIAMLILPGQGVLTILIGLSLLNFPGKYRVERWLITRKPVLRTVNWIREKAHRPPLIVSDDETPPGGE